MDNFVADGLIVQIGVSPWIFLVHTFLDFYLAADVELLMQKERTI
jgi:hypothetical protein